jgi:DNA replication and repair protein RecF
MRLEHLAARAFRNLGPVDLDVGRRFVVVHGDNAQGKTNLVGAIYLLATLKPLRGHRTRDLVGWGQAESSVAGVVRHDGLARRYRIDLAEGARRVSLDGKAVHDLEQYFRGIRAIAFTPSDAEIVTGEPRLRRAWVDRAAFTARPSHLDAVRTFKRVLDQKAAALRGGVDRRLLDALDDQLALAGARLVGRRVEILEELRSPVATVHDAIAGRPAQLDLRYRTEAEGADEPARAARLRERLAGARSEELRRQRCLVGPQGDDVALRLDAHSARAFGSQGQVRSVVLALKLGELLAAHARGEAPLFLFDDVSSELDASRTHRLVALLAGLDAQVFATTTDPSQLAALPSAETLRVRVEGGLVRADGE